MSKSNAKIKTAVSSEDNASETSSKRSYKKRQTSKSPTRRKPSKSPTRKQRQTSKSPTRFSARIKSPGRKQSPTPVRRNASPGRLPKKNKSPTKRQIELSPPKLSSTPVLSRPTLRRSPPRMAKQGSANAVSERVQRSSASNFDTESESEGEAKLRSAAGYSKRDSRSKELDNNKVKLVQHFTRSFINRETDLVEVKNFDIAMAKKIGEFSDEDAEVEQITQAEQVQQITKNMNQIMEFGGWPGALFFILITPISMFGLLLACNEYQCSFKQIPNLKRFATVSAFYNPISYLGVVAYLTLLALLSIVPFGGRKVQGMLTKEGKFVYIMNGFFSFVVLLSILIGLEVKGIKISAFITENLLQLHTISFVCGLLLTIYAYVRSFYVPISALNIYAANKNPIYAFFMGREVSPRMFGLLDLKMYVYRLGIIGSLFVDYAFLVKSLTLTSGGGTTPGNGTLLLDNWLLDEVKSWNYHPTLILLIVMHSIYFLNGIVLENTWITSFEIQYEGFGYMSGVGYLIFPFMIGVVTKYVVVYNINLPNWQLALIGLVFTIGYILFVGSNKQKDAFRKNPYGPAVSHLETIPTGKGKKLICSGFWGIVRHPNYLGDILMNLAFTPFVWNVPPVVTVVSIVLLLVHRSVRDNERCKEKYGPAWDRYCSKVKYVLLPKIY